MASELKNSGLRKRDSNTHLVKSSLKTTGETLLCDIFTDKARQIVPNSLRRQVFNSIHSPILESEPLSRPLPIVILGQV